MSRLRPLCGVAALLALLATVSAQNAVSQTCTGGARRQECGATWAPNNAFVPTNRCATCPADFGCTCPKAECMSIVSACLAAPGLVSYQVSLAGCKGTGRSGPQADVSNIDWVAFQGVNGDNTSFTIQSAMNPNQNLYTFDNTTACDNIPNKDAASTCCLQRNVNGNGQINTFTVPCGTRPVVWMKDKTFRSCVQAANIPDYLTAVTGPNQCSGAGESTSNLCGPYALPQQSCEALQPCNPNDQTLVSASVTINNNNWADFSQTCIPGTICRFAANACEGDAYWNSACQCPALNPIRAGYCYYSWRGFDNNAVCICGDDWWAIDNWPPIIYPRPPWWNNWWCNGRVCDTWRPICKRPPCAGTCNYWGCPGFPGVRPPIKPCRGKECPGWPGDKPITPCRGRDCVGPPTKPVPPIGECRGRHCGQICPKGSRSCPGFDTKPTPLPGKPEGGFGRPVKPRPERPVEKPSTLPAKPTDKPTTLPGKRPVEKPSTLPAKPTDKPTTLPAKPEVPSTLPAKPEVPSTLPAKPEVPSTLPAKPETPTVAPLPGKVPGSQIPSTLPGKTGPLVPSPMPDIGNVRPLPGKTIPGKPSTLPSKPDAGGVTTLPAKPDVGGVTTLPARPDVGGVTTLPATTGPTTRPSGGFGNPAGGGIVGGDTPVPTRPGRPTRPTTTTPSLTLPGTSDTISTTRPTGRPTTSDTITTTRPTSRPTPRPVPVERPTPAPRPSRPTSSSCRPGQPGCPGGSSSFSRPSAPSMRPNTRPTRPSGGGGGGGGGRGGRGGH